jgi:hypothetical protein
MQSGNFVGIAGSEILAQHHGGVAPAISVDVGIASILGV